MFNLHAVIGCHCAVKRDCIFHVLTPLPINNSAQAKIDIYLTIILSLLKLEINPPFHQYLPYFSSDKLVRLLISHYSTDQYSVCQAAYMSLLSSV